MVNGCGSRCTGHKGVEALMVKWVVSAVVMMIVVLTAPMDGIWWLQ